jgi:hypothetical protein
MCIAASECMTPDAGGDREPARSGLARRFIDALLRAEESGNADELVGLFDDDAELRSFVHDESLHGIDGARRFWREYLSSFQRLRSRFERVSDLDGLAVLEWVSEGTLASGTPITYRGVSLVEHDGDRVRSFPHVLRLGGARWPQLDAGSASAAVASRDSAHRESWSTSRVPRSAGGSGSGRLP